jgi:hypothetical protein
MHSRLDKEKWARWSAETLKIYSQARCNAIPWIESPSPFFYIASMELSPVTASLLSELDTFSGGTIAHRPDLGILLESGRVPRLRDLLEELSFFSKFLDRTYRIMTRIGRNGEGYDRLASEFAEAVAKTRDLVTSLIAESPGDVRKRFAGTYLALTQDGLENLLSLCHDLSWYKNWLIDTKRERKGRT